MTNYAFFIFCINSEWESTVLNYAHIILQLLYTKNDFFKSLCLFCHLVVNYKHKRENLQVTL